MGKKASKTSPSEVKDSGIPISAPPTPEPENHFKNMSIGLKKFCDMVDERKFDMDTIIQFLIDNQEDIEQVQYSSREIVYQIGSQPKGLHIVVEGEVSILSEHKLSGQGDNIELMRVPCKDFFCDVETVYGMPCSTTNRSFNESVVSIIPPECVQQLLSENNAKKPDIETWFVLRRYPPNIPSLNHKRIYERICMSVLQQTTLFCKWTPAVLESFQEFMPKQPVILYTAGSNIVKAGDKADSLLILIRGRADAFDKRNKLCTYQSAKFPFSIGEEGMFLSGWQHRLSVTADTPCHVLQVDKDLLWHASDNIWEFADGAEPYWSNTIKKWERIHSMLRKGDIYALNSIHGPELQIEVQYQSLRSNPSFASCQPTFVYELAKCGQGILVKKDKFFSYEDLAKGCVLVLKGELHLIQAEELKHIENTDETALDVFTSHSLIYYTDMGDTDLFLFAKKECLMVKFSKQDLLNELRNYPGNSLNFLDSSFNKT